MCKKKCSNSVYCSRAVSLKSRSALNVCTNSLLCNQHIQAHEKYLVKMSLCRQSKITNFVQNFVQVYNFRPKVTVNFILRLRSFFTQNEFVVLLEILWCLLIDCSLSEHRKIVSRQKCKCIGDLVVK